jgi:hypothetical protein
MSEPIGGSSNDNTDVDDQVTKKSDLMKVSGGVISHIRIKMGFLLFFFGMLIFSDIFVDNLLNEKMHDGAGCPNTLGTVTQLTCLVLLYLVLDLLDQYEFI